MSPGYTRSASAGRVTRPSPTISPLRPTAPTPDPVAKKRNSRRQGTPQVVRKPRVPALVALASSPGPKGAGPHGKSERAKRRAAKVALAKSSPDAGDDA